MAPFLPATPAAPASRREAFAALKATMRRAGVRRHGLDTEALVATGVQALDDLLGGGFPRGILAVLEGDLGRSSIAARLLAQATRRGMAAVLDDGELYPPGLVQAGVRLDRPSISWRRCRCRARAPPTSSCARASAERSSCRPWRCAHRFGRVWRGSRTAPARWSRSSPADRQRPRPTFATVRLRCTLERLLLCGSRGPWCNFASQTAQT